jgi:hypothetical protein
LKKGRTFEFFNRQLLKLSFTAVPVEYKAMNRPPRPPSEGLFLGGRGLFILLTPALSAVVLFAIDIEKLWIRIQQLTV